jgi:hypothetical protein
MASAYIAANTLEVLSMRVARRSRRGAPLVSAAEQLRTSLCLLRCVEASDREIYRVATRRIVRSCARAWLAARRAGTVEPDEHHAAREAMVRVLAATPAPLLPPRRTLAYGSRC